MSGSEPFVVLFINMIKLQEPRRIFVTVCKVRFKISLGRRIKAIAYAIHLQGADVETLARRVDPATCDLVAHVQTVLRTRRDLDQTSG